MNSHIFKYFEEDSLREVLSLYHSCTDLHVQLIDDNGQILISIGTNSDFCKEFAKHLPPNDTCTREHVSASYQALNLGESYLFSCHAGLYHIVFPIVSRSHMFGSVVAGPFLMDEPDSSLILDIEYKYHYSTEILLSLSEHLYHIKLITPELANNYSKLLYYLVNNLNKPSDSTLSSNKGKLLQQSKISDSIHMYKNGGYVKDNYYPIQKENELIAKIKSGSLEDARALLNDLLGVLMLKENLDLERMKIRIMELCTLLSRAAIDRGADSQSMIKLNDRLIASIVNSDDLNDVCLTIQDNIEIFTESLFYSSDSGNQAIKNATEYIHAHFAEPITLTDVAIDTHLNKTYLSTLFKQVTSKSFRDYLNEIRVNEAQRLLENTDYSILDIAVACGFNDQSYFTKVFKKHTGLTPRQFR